MAARVLLYLTDYCPYCHAARQLLNKKGATIEEVSVENRPELRDWMIEASGQRTVPQIFINSHSVGGFSDLAALDRDGKLDGMLAEDPTDADMALPT